MLHRLERADQPAELSPLPDAGAWEYWRARGGQAYWFQGDEEFDTDAARLLSTEYS